MKAIEAEEQLRNALEETGNIYDALQISMLAGITSQELTNAYMSLLPTLETEDADLILFGPLYSLEIFIEKVRLFAELLELRQKTEAVLTMQLKETLHELVVKAMNKELGEDLIIKHLIIPFLVDHPSIGPKTNDEDELAEYAANYIATMVQASESPTTE